MTYSIYNGYSMRTDGARTSMLAVSVTYSGWKQGWEIKTKLQIIKTLKKQTNTDYQQNKDNIMHKILLKTYNCKKKIHLLIPLIRIKFQLIQIRGIATQALTIVVYYQPMNNY